MIRIQKQRLADVGVVGGVELVFDVCYRGGTSLVGGNIALKHRNQNPSDNLWISLSQSSLPSAFGYAC